jgi:PilZ domain
MNAVNRRRFERFAVSPMYTEVKVCSLEGVLPTFHGHAYDVSEGGVQFELDRMLKPGTPVAMELTFPGSAFDPIDPAASTVVVVGNVVWADDSEPGPVRMALAITRFARETDRERLIHHLSKGRITRAA